MRIRVLSESRWKRAAPKVTKSFKELVQRRVARDPDFATVLLREGIDTMLTGDVDAGKATLRDYIKATVGFEKLDEATATPAKSLIRMFGARGNPQARNLFGVIGCLQSRPASSCTSRKDSADQLPSPTFEPRQNGLFCVG